MEHSGEFYENIYRNGPSGGAGLPFLYTAAKTLHENPADPLEHPRWHEQIEIKYMLRGKAEIICGPKLFLAEEGDIIVINSCELHGIRQYGDTEPVYHLLMVSVGQMIRELGCTALLPVLEGKAAFRNLIRGDAVMQNVFTALFAELEKEEPAHEMAACGYLSVLFALLLRESVEENPLGKPENRKYIDKIHPAIEYIREHYNEPIRVGHLASACSLSPFHFSRLFRQVTGYTPVTYTTQFRLYKAATLLETSRMSVADVAAAVGYEDEAYFSRCFRNHMHISPSGYRENAEQLEKEQDNPSESQNPACTET